MISFSHVSKTFGTPEHPVYAVQDVSLEIREGEIFGIIGFSGAGKSTLIRMVNRLETPDSGTVTVDGHRLAGLSKAELRQVRRKTVLESSSSTCWTLKRFFRMWRSH